MGWYTFCHLKPTILKPSLWNSNVSYRNIHRKNFRKCSVLGDYLSPRANLFPWNPLSWLVKCFSFWYFLAVKPWSPTRLSILESAAEMVMGPHPQLSSPAHASPDVKAAWRVEACAPRSPPATPCAHVRVSVQLHFWAWEGICPSKRRQQDQSEKATPSLFISSSFLKKTVAQLPWNILKY